MLKTSQSSVGIRAGNPFQSSEVMTCKQACFLSGLALPSEKFSLERLNGGIIKVRFANTNSFVCILFFILL